MAGTRSSARIASQTSNSPSSSQTKLSPKSAGKKRKSEAESSPAAKRGKKGVEKDQKTIEETMTDGPAPSAEKTEDAPTPAINQPENNGEVPKEQDEPSEDKPGETAEKKDEQASNTNGTSGAKAHTESTLATKEEPTETNDEDSKMEDAGSVTTKEEEKTQPAESSNSNNAVEPEVREDETPSSILEKGIIYFLFRGRVGIDEPQNVGDIARSYMVMRPLPHGAKLGDGPMGDEGNCRLLALPKKVLPLSGKDRFMTFVEKAKTTIKDLKNTLGSSDYETKTAGTRHSPATTPVAEGVYAITTTGRESHLAYIITIPSELGEVQKDIGLHDRGSFIVSARNPQYEAPANTGLPKGADYPKEILDEFRSLRWMPLQPKLLEYEKTQFLLIGESKGMQNAMEPQKEDEKEGKETPMEEMEKLEGEDEIRVKHLKGAKYMVGKIEIQKKSLASKKRINLSWSAGRKAWAEV